MILEPTSPRSIVVDTLGDIWYRNHREWVCLTNGQLAFGPLKVLPGRFVEQHGILEVLHDGSNTLVATRVRPE